MVTLTASATSVTPWRIAARAPTPKLISLLTKFLLDNTPPYTCPQKSKSSFLCYSHCEITDTLLRNIYIKHNKSMAIQNAETNSFSCTSQCEISLKSKE